MKIDSFLSAFLLFVVLIGVSMPVAYAQDGMPNASQPVPKAAPSAPIQSMPPDEEEITILRDEYAGKYNLATLENLSKIYWRLGAFDFEDDVAVGNYIKINDCKVFTEYLNDDMEWAEIVKTMKQHLKTQSPTFPLNFQFVLELHLGRYDMERGGFPIVDRTGFRDAKRIEVDSMDQGREVCFDSANIKDYPRSVVILLPRPFTLDFLKLDEHVAQAYILRKKSEFNKLDEAVRVKQYERSAYLRLRVTFSQYHGNLRGEGSNTMAILYGNIDGYEIFEDAGQKRLMLSVDLTKQAQVDAPQMSMPQASAPAAAPTMGFAATPNSPVIETSVTAP
jgi:hypothetical protein